MKKPGGDTDDIVVKMTRLGRVRLSAHFMMSQFLYNPTGAALGISNYPDDVERVIESGTRLCKDILEPVWDKFGPMAIPYGYASNKVVSVTEPNLPPKKSSPHTWDRETFGKQIYARTDFILYSILDGIVDLHAVGEWMMDNLDIDMLMQWGRPDKQAYFCISVCPKPRRVWLEWCQGGTGDDGSNKKTFRGEHYWQEIWPSLPEDKRPAYGPSMSGGKMYWPKQDDSHQQGDIFTAI